MRKQCEFCPWRVDVDPFDIPDGYSMEKHKDLDSTIASGTRSLRGAVVIMACHHSAVGDELPCVGWLANQLGPGNNLGLRMLAMTGKVPGGANFELVGEQHETLEDTLPAL